MTREQFEAHVRAEALKEFPGVAPKFDPFHQVGIRIEDINWGIIETKRSTHIDARMEHEWPLVDAGSAMLSLLSMHLPVEGLECSDCRYDFGKGHNAGCDVPRIEKAVASWNELLSPYTTKPIER